MANPNYGKASLLKKCHTLYRIHCISTNVVCTKLLHRGRCGKQKYQRLDCKSIILSFSRNKGLGFCQTIQVKIFPRPTSYPQCECICLSTGATHYHAQVELLRQRSCNQRVGCLLDNGCYGKGEIALNSLDDHLKIEGEFHPEGKIIIYYLQLY